MKKSSSVVHCLIPARGGSKSIPHKNIVDYKGEPMIVHTIRCAKESKYISEIIVSTDCKTIANIAKENGATVPFMRPSKISTDLSPDIETFVHYLDFLRKKRKELPDIIVHLRVTYPERTSELVDNCIEIFSKFENKDYSSLRSVVLLEKSMFKMYTIQNKCLIPNHDTHSGIKEPHNQVRQILPKTYLHNGCVDIVRRCTIEKNSMTGNRIYPYVMKKEETYDIDTFEDLKKSLNKKIS